MKLLLLSDLHLEWGDFDVPDVNPDVVVIAGDLHTGTHGVRWAQERLPHIPVLYVLGNHEYYGHSLPRTEQKIRAAAADLSSRIHVLERDSYRVGDVLFLGATLWTDFKLLGDPQRAMAEARDTMVDYRRIRVDPEYRRLRPSDTAAIHTTTRTWLRSELANADAERVVVVTHHAPSIRSVHPEHQDDPISGAYASDLEEELLGVADLWVHGHAHFAVDYDVNGTRVVSNPRGYVGEEEVVGFKSDLIVEV